MSGRYQRGLVAAFATLLATAPLMAIYEGLGWLASCAVMIATIAAAAAAARALRAPVWLQAPAMLVAWLVGLTVLFSGGQQHVGLIPSAATFAEFERLLGMVGSDIRNHATPVPSLESLTFVTAAGVGLVAVVVDLLAAGLRRPALAGLPMLAIYSVPVAVSLDSVPMVLFGIGALGYLWLLGTEHMDRVRRFGRRFTGDGRDVEAWEPSPLAAAGRRLAVVGVLVAIALPVAVPGMTSGLVDRFGPTGGTGEGAGVGGSGRVNLFAELYGQLNQDETVEMLRIQSDDPDPFYLRLATADQITDSGFEPSPPSGTPVSEVSTAPAGAGVERHHYRASVDLADVYGMSLAPTYADLVEVSGLDDSWLYDHGQQIVYLGGGGATPPDYEFSYLRPEYDADALRRARPLRDNHEIQLAYGHAPDLPQVQDLLDSLVDPTDSSYDQVRSILDFFSRDNGFRYDLTTGPETSAPAIVDFLDHRSGFCVQYASAMAWLARSVDLPARVAFGFTRGRRDSEDTRVLTNRNLHAWTEVYFEGFGWVPFDPTPGTAIAGSANAGWAPNPQAPADPSAPDGSNGAPGDPAATPGAGPDNNLGPEFADDVDFGGGAPPSDTRGPWWLVAVAAGALLLLAQPALHRSLLRRRRVTRRATPAGATPAGATPAGATPPGGVVAADTTVTDRHRAHGAWAELLDTMVDLQVPVDPTETPRSTAHRLATSLAEQAGAAQAAQQLGQAEERARYARQPQTPDGLAAAVAAVRTGLGRETGAWVRLRARLLPPSTLWRWRTATSDAAASVVTAMGRAAEALARLSPRRLLRAAR